MSGYPQYPPYNAQGMIPPGMVPPGMAPGMAPPGMVPGMMPGMVPPTMFQQMAPVQDINQHLQQVQQAYLADPDPNPIAHPATQHKHVTKVKKPKKHLRQAADKVWEDISLDGWPDDDYRIFCGDLGNEVTDEVLRRAFQEFHSLQRWKVIRDKRTSKSKGFGFLSFSDPQDFVNALKTKNGKYVGNRPIRLRKSNWQEREVVDLKNKKVASTGLPKQKKVLPPKITLN